MTIDMVWEGRMRKIGNAWMMRMNATINYCRSIRNAFVVVAIVFVGGCGQSHSAPDMASSDVGVHCGFLADGECPAGCRGVAGLRAAELPTECVRVEDGHDVWCSDPSALESFSWSCFQLPSGEFIMMTSIPGDFPDEATPCSVNPLLLCGS